MNSLTMFIFRETFLCALLFTILFTICNLSEAKKQKSSVVTGINDNKEFKKLLRTKNNVLALFVIDQAASQPVIETFRETADVVRGHATVTIIDCFTKEGKKMCKTLKISESKPYSIKHFKDGRYHKDYDRNRSVSSIVNFLNDPTGELPWAEDPHATNIVHLEDGDALVKFLKRGPAAFQKSMVMFYTPWCSYCKILKPDYVLAAADLKGEAILAAIDVAKPGNSKVRHQFNITGFPTLLYYDNGVFRYPYSGENKRKGIVEFMRDPSAQLDAKPPLSADESWSNDSDVVHLTLDNFDEQIAKVEDALVVFYAPWCGHCKKIKPEYEKAAATLKKLGIKGLLAAVDVTQHAALGSRFSVTGYPTIKYFKNGEFQFDAGHVRDEKKLVEFMKSPQEPPPPPPPEQPWSEQESAVRHLTADTFRSALRKVKHALVMFYAPWCGHCKRAKPEIMKAAEKFDLELRVLFGAVDCTMEQILCNIYNVTGYPTIKYFSHFDKVVSEYEGGRMEKDFVNFIHSQLGDMQDAKKGVDHQAAGFGRNVVLLTDKTFDSTISESKPTFVMFYATWCGHCSETKPAYSQLATRMKSKGAVNIVAIDVGTYLEVADKTGVSTMPTFKLYNSGKLVADYEGDRSLDDFVNFLNNYIPSSDKNEL